MAKGAGLGRRPGRRVGIQLLPLHQEGTALVAEVAGPEEAETIRLRGNGHFAA